MSAFSDFNGPNCGGGASLPQIQTLEKLLGDIATLTTKLNNDITNLTTHMNDQSAGVHGVSITIAAAIAEATDVNSSLQGQINALKDLTNGFAGANSIWNAINGTGGVAAQLSTLQSTVDGITTKLTGITGNLKTYIDGADTGIGNAAAADATQKVNALRTELQAAITTDLINLKTTTSAFLVIAANVQMLRAYVSDVIDFTAFAAYNAPMHTDDNGNQVRLLGMLSEAYRTGAPLVPTTNKMKPARAYIKYVNTQPFNAIADMTATPSTSEPHGYAASLTVLAAKTGGSTKPITFGLYTGTSGEGANHVYLGVVPQIGSTDIQYLVAGENFIPCFSGATWLPNGGLHALAEAKVVDDEGFSVSNLNVRGSIQTDSYEDARGAPVLTIDDIDKTINLGQSDKELVLNSKTRPTVIANGKHDLAYLDDLASSIKWQRSVLVVADDLATLNGFKVATLNGDIVAPGAAGSTPEPGFYKGFANSGDVRGHLFVDGDIALVKNAYHEQDVPDGHSNTLLQTTLGASQQIAIGDIVGIDWDFARAGATALTSTTVVDDIGTVGYISSLPPTFNNPTALVTVVTTNDVGLFDYSIPAYATFDGGSGTWVLDIEALAIEVPKALGGYTSDITYEWSGYHEIPDGPDDIYAYMNEAYIMWTAHHENDAGMKYTGDAWDTIDLEMVQYPTLPIGIMQIWPSALGDAPVGWLRCLGQEVLQSSYPDLYALVGTRFGTATAPGRFVLPYYDETIIRWAPGADTNPVNPELAGIDFVFAHDGNWPQLLVPGTLIGTLDHEDGKAPFVYSFTSGTNDNNKFVISGSQVRVGGNPIEYRSAPYVIEVTVTDALGNTADGSWTLQTEEMTAEFTAITGLTGPQAAGTVVGKIDVTGYRDSFQILKHADAAVNNELFDFDADGTVRLAAIVDGGNIKFSVDIVDANGTALKVALYQQEVDIAWLPLLPNSLQFIQDPDHAHAPIAIGSKIGYLSTGTFPNGPVGTPPLTYSYLGNPASGDPDFTVDPDTGDVVTNEFIGDGTFTFQCQVVDALSNESTVNAELVVLE